MINHSSMHSNSYLTTSNKFQQINNSYPYHSKKSIGSSNSRRIHNNTTTTTMNKMYNLSTYTLAQIVNAMWLIPTLCAVLICASHIQIANAHSLVDNSIHGGEQNSHNHLANNNNRQNTMNKNMLMQTSSSDNVNQNRCQSGWMWFNNKCWVTTQSRRDFAHAIELCKKMHNSTLPTIHSEDENEFLRQNIDLHNSPIWLYAKHNHQYNKTLWLDKTPTNYTRWEVGQPSDKSSLVCIKTEDSWYMKKAEPVNGQTECVSFWEDAKWGTQVGCLVLLPVVCERKLPPIKRFADGSINSQDPSNSISQSEQQQMYPVTGSSASSLIHLVNENSMNIYILMSSYLSYYLFSSPLLLNQNSRIIS